MILFFFSFCFKNEKNDEFVIDSYLIRKSTSTLNVRKAMVMSVNWWGLSLEEMIWRKYVFSLCCCFMIACGPILFSMPSSSSSSSFCSAGLILISVTSHRQITSYGNEADGTAVHIKMNMKYAFSRKKKEEIKYLVTQQDRFLIQSNWMQDENVAATRKRNSAYFIWVSFFVGVCFFVCTNILCQQCVFLFVHFRLLWTSVTNARRCRIKCGPNW